jgi:hypothetical protein
MKWWLAVLAPLVVDVAACTMPAWLNDDGPIVYPHELVTGIDGSPNQHHAMTRGDAGHVVDRSDSGTP